MIPYIINAARTSAVFANFGKARQRVLQKSNIPRFHFRYRGLYSFVAMGTGMGLTDGNEQREWIPLVPTPFKKKAFSIIFEDSWPPRPRPACLGRWAALCSDPLVYWGRCGAEYCAPAAGLLSKLSLHRGENLAPGMAYGQRGPFVSNF